MSADDTLGSPPPRPSWRPEELLGRRVCFHGTVGRVAEVSMLSAPHVAILTREGSLLRVPAQDWGEIEVLR